MVRAFFQAEKLRQKRANEEAWLNGLYVHYALAATVGNMGLKKGEKPLEYPSEPINFERSEEEREEDDALFAKAWMTQFVEAGKAWGKNK